MKKLISIAAFLSLCTACSSNQASNQFSSVASADYSESYTEIWGEDGEWGMTNDGFPIW